MDAHQMTSGGFFAVDRPSWHKACNLGLNPAVAYLVLARGTGRNNLVTSWSVHAVETYTGISRSRAVAAIDALVDAKLIVQTREGRKPRYRIGVEVMADVKGPEWIWLPNELVTGAASEIPPLELVRQAQDVMLLRLLVDLYHEQNLREDGGVRKNLIWQVYEKTEIGQQGQHVVYGFPHIGSAWVKLTGPFAAHAVTPTPVQAARGRRESYFLFLRIDQLVALGLLEWVPCLMEGESEVSEIIHPLGGDEIGRSIGKAAHEAGLRMLTEGQRDRANDQHMFLLPISRHLPQATVIGVARLRYRPKTRLTAAWWAHHQEVGASAISRYEALGRPDADKLEGR